jgi:hypothetical protein
MLANAFVTALTAWLLYRCVLELDYRPTVAVLTALAYGLGTMAWPYAKYLFSEPLTTLGLVLALWGLLALRRSRRRRVHDTRRTGGAGFAFLAGVGLGLALLAKVANGVAWPFFLAYGLWIIFYGREGGSCAGMEEGRGLPAPTDQPGAYWLAGAFLAPLVLTGLVLAAYNLARTGQLFDLGYAADETFSTPLWLGLAGFLFSPGKSLFLFSPILLAALFGIPALLRRDRATALLSLAVVVAYPLLYAGWFMWWGGWSWGPRFLVPVLPFLCLFLAPVLDWALQSSRGWARALLIVLALASVGVQVLGAAVDFNRYLLILYGRGLDSSEINFRPALTPLLGHWALIRAGEWDLAWATDLKAGGRVVRLAWPLALLAGALLGWLATARQGRFAGWLLAGASLVALLFSALALTHQPAQADDWRAGCQVLSEEMQAMAESDDLLLVDLLPYGDHFGRTAALLDCYRAVPAFWGWAREEPVSPERQVLLEGLSQEHGRLWLLLETTPEGDPASTTEQWLDHKTFRAGSQWLSPAMRLVRYESAPDGLYDEPQARLDLRLGEHLWLLGHSPAPPRGAGAPFEVRAGEALPLSLFWRADQPVAESYAVFMQLLDGQGGLQAQVDAVPVGGFRPTDAWQPGEVIRDNYAFMVPADLPPGEYQLIVGLYSPSTVERLPVRAADGTGLGDYIPLATIAVIAEQ